MLTVFPDWRAWRERVAAAESLGEVAAALREVADEMRPYLGRSETGLAQWRRLGVWPARVALAAGGGCRRDGGELVVLMKADDDPRRQRFTVAHEIAHLLLDEVRRGVQLSLRKEERLCDEFASTLLVPRHLLRQEFDRYGRIHPSDITRLCNRFGVSLQPLLLALAGEIGHDQVLFVARRRPHPVSGGEIAFRFHASAAKTIYLPRHQRLSSVGLETLAAWAEQPHAGSEVGVEDVEFELRRPSRPRSGIARGRVEWSARILRNGLLLVALDVTGIRSEWRKSREQVAA